PAAAWNLLGGIAAPIFHGGALSAHKRAAEDAYDAAFAQYQQTVLDSFKQVAQTLHALNNDADAVRDEQEALSSAQTARDLAQRGYRGGAASIVQLLDAQRQEQLATVDLLKAKAARYNDTVRLFIVCGGGVTDSGQVPVADTPTRRR